MFDELLGKQVVCHDVGILQFMYPTHKIVTYISDIEKDKPFIYIGDIKYINKVRSIDENCIVVSFTGNYNLDIRQDLIKLAYLKHNKKIPKYVQELIKVWDDNKFYYNWKLLYIHGVVEEKDIENNKKFYEIIENVNKPYLLIKNYLENTDLVENKFFESALISFIKNSKNITGANTKNYMSLKLRQSFYNSYNKNIKYSVERILDSTIELESLRFLNLLVDLVFGDIDG